MLDSIVTVDVPALKRQVISIPGTDMKPLFLSCFMKRLPLIW